MADEAQDVGGIALPLQLETTGWSEGIERAKAELTGLQEAAAAVTTRRPESKVAVAAPPLRITPAFSVTSRDVRDLRADINQTLRAHAGQGQAVGIPIKLGRSPWAAIRSEIAANIGVVPVKVTIGQVTPQARNILQAVMSVSGGVSMGQAQKEIESAGASRGIPRRATGGTVTRNAPVIVGDAGRPEVFVPDQHGRIEAMARGGNVRAHLQRAATSYSLGMPKNDRDLYYRYAKNQDVYETERLDAIAQAQNRRRLRDLGRRRRVDIIGEPEEPYSQWIDWMSGYRRNAAGGFVPRRAGTPKRRFLMGAAARSAEHADMERREYEERGPLLFEPEFYAGAPSWQAQEPQYGSPRPRDIWRRFPMRRRGGPGYGGKYGAARPGVSTPPREPGWAYHATGAMEAIRRSGGVRPLTESLFHETSSYWATAPLTNYGKGVLRTSGKPEDWEWSGTRYGPAGSQPSEIYQAMRTVPLNRLQYWGEDEGWHQFRRGRARAKGTPRNLTPEQMDYLGNLREVAARITPDQLKFGKVWYSDAQGYAHRKAREYGVSTKMATGVLAALSAGTAWDANKTKFERVMSTRGLGLFGESFPYNMNLDSHRKAKAILSGMDPMKAFATSPKVGQFYRNLSGDLDALTLDRWAYRSATRGALSQYGKGPVRDDIDVAFRQVAKELGLHPVEFQAAAWLNERETNPRIPKRGQRQSIGQLEGLFHPIHRARGGVVQISRLPGGGRHVAPIAGDLHAAVDAAVGHYQTHTGPGGYVGIAPIGRGVAVQLHGAEGDIESWRILRHRRAGTPHNRLLQAYLDTLSNEGGTFGPLGAAKRGYVVGLEREGSAIIPANRPLAFEHAFRRGERLGWPNVGTWSPANEDPRQIYIDPAVHLTRKRAAEHLTLREAQRAYFDLQKMDEVYPRWRRGNPSPGQMSFHFAQGGQIDWRKEDWRNAPRVENVKVSTLLPLREIDREHHPRFGRDFAYLDELTEKIRAEGFSSQHPVQVWYDPFGHKGILGDGNHRLAVAQRLGMETVPTTVVLNQQPGKFKGHAMSGSSWVQPNEYGYVPASLPPSFIGLRAQGGPAKAGGLPRGYSIGFYEPNLDITGHQDWAIRATDPERFLMVSRPAGTQHRKAGYTDPAARGRTMRAPVAFYRGQPIAAAPMTYDYSREAWHPENTYVDYEHRRKGIATAMYEKLGRWSGLPVEPALGEQTPEGQAFWAGRRLPKGLQRRFKSELGVIRSSLRQTRWEQEQEELDPHTLLQQGLLSLSGEGPWVNIPLARSTRAAGTPEGPLARRLRELQEQREGKLPVPTIPIRPNEPESDVPLWLRRARNKGFIEKEFRKTGGDAGGQPYVVGEIGRELFVPDRKRRLIPPSVFAQLPKRADGTSRDKALGNGLFELGAGDHMFVPPEDGWIIPNRLMNKVPRRQEGTRWSARGPMGRFVSRASLPTIDLTPEPIGSLRLGPRGELDIPTFMRRARPATESRRTLETAEERAVRIRSLSDAELSRRDLEATRRAEARMRPVETARPSGRDIGWFRSLFAGTSMGEGPSGGSRMAEPYAEAAQQMALTTSATRGLTPRSVFGGLGEFIFGGGRERRVARAEAMNLTQQLTQMVPRELRGSTDAITYWTHALKEGNTRLESEDKTLSKLARTHGTATKEYAAQEAKVNDLRGQLETINETQSKAVELEKRRTAAVDAATGGIAKNLAAATVSGFAFNAGMQAVGLASDMALKSLAPAADMMQGFGATTTRLTADMAKQAQQTGNVRAAIAQAAMTGGVGAAGAAYGQALTPYVTAKAGAGAAEQGMEFRRAAFGATRGNAPTGLYGGYGGLLGTPLFGQFMGGGKGFTENIAGEASGYANQMATPRLISAGGMSPTQTQMVAGLNPALAARLNAVGGATSTYAPLTSDEQKKNADAWNALRVEASDYNEAMQRGSRALGQNQSSLKLLTDEQLRSRGMLDKDIAKLHSDFEATGKAAGDEDNARTISKSHLLLFDDATGKAVDSTKAYQQAMEQAAQGTTIPTQQAFANQMALQLQGARQASAAQTARAMAVTIPSQLGMQLATSPFAPATTGTMFAAGVPGRTAVTGGPNIAGLPVAGTSNAAIGGQLGFAQSLQDTLMRQAVEGLKTQQNDIRMQVGPQAATQFGQLMGNPVESMSRDLSSLFSTISAGSGSVSDYGAAITKLNANIANRQATLNVAQYNEQMRVLNRNLTYARGLAGQAGGATNLGALERQQFYIGRASEQLGLAQTQRQINFQMALAGFQSSGLTGQERAARTEEAKIQAQYAQQQLDYQKQQFQIAGTVFTVNAQNQLQDLERQRSISAQSFSVEQAILADQKVIAGLTIGQAQQQAKAQAITQQANANFDSVLGAASQYVSTFGDNIQSATDAIRAAIGLNPLYSKAPTASQYGRTAKAAQTGWVGNISQPASVTIGEAGNEMAAILRHPKTLPLTGAFMGGGAGMQVNIPITISGNNISSSMDLHEIARAVGEEVETRLSQKASMLRPQGAF